MQPQLNTSISDFQLMGLDDRHLVDLPEFACRLQPALAEPLQALAGAAATAGFDLQVASGFRSFDRQLAIWNAKARGERPVLDDSGRALDVLALDERQRVEAILRWSALPGASRHHWGTDLDIYDAAHLPAGYRLQLTLDECRPGGCCGAFHQWLDEQLATGNWGFYRPYDRDRGGVSPEPWHLSYRPLAAELAPRLTPALLRRQLQGSAIELRAVLLDNLEQWLARFVSLLEEGPR